MHPDEGRVHYVALVMQLPTLLQCKENSSHYFQSLPLEPYRGGHLKYYYLKSPAVVRYHSRIFLKYKTPDIL